MNSASPPLEPRFAAVLEPLLAPVPGPAPTGRSVLYERDYADIEEARRDEDPALPQGVWVRDLKRADWAEVERLCGETLRERSKDLRVAAWLTEAWAVRDGFAGLGRGFALMTALARRYWPGLFPALDGDDATARLAPFGWLAQRLPITVNGLPLVVDARQPDVRYGWSDFVAMQRLEHLRQRDPAEARRAEERGARTLAQFADCQRQTPDAALAAHLDGLALAQGELAVLEATLGEVAGREAPGFTRLRGLLRDIAAFVQGALHERRTAAGAAPVPLPQPTDPPAAAAAAPTAPVAAEPTREEVYRQLARLAEALAKIEPHSPTPLVLREVAAWGELSLPELQARLADGGSDVALLLQVVGLADAWNSAAGRP
jgi:type VI secretion system protein ImpA